MAAIEEPDLNIPHRNDLQWTGLLITGSAFFIALFIGMLASGNSTRAIALLVAIPLVASFIRRPVFALIFCCPLAILVPPWYTLMDFGIPIVQLDVFRTASLFLTVVLFTGICTRRYVNLSIDRIGFVVILLSLYSFISCIGFWDEEIMRSVYNLLYVPLLFYFTVKFFPLERKHLDLIEKLFISAAIVLSLTMIYESFMLNKPLFVSPDVPAYQWVENEYNVFRAGGMTGSAPQAGLLLGIIIFLSYGRLVKSRCTSKLIYLTACLIILTAILLTYTRAAWFAVLVGSLMYMYFTGRPRFFLYLAVLLTVAIVLFFMPLDFSDDFMQKGITRPGTLFSRFAFWKEALDIYTSSLKNMIFGIGFLGSRQIEIVGSPLLVEVGTHCYYLTLLLETGVIGLFLYLLLGYIMMRTMRRNLASAASDKEAKKYVLFFCSISTMFIVNLVGDYTKSQNELIIFMILLSLLVNHPHLILGRPPETVSGDKEPGSDLISL